MNFIKKISSKVEGGIKPDSVFLKRLSKFFIGTEDRIKLYRKIAKDLKYGMALQSSLEKQYKTSSRKSKTDFRAVMLYDILTKIRSGFPFSRSLENYASINEMMIISAGENSSALPKSLDFASELLKASKQMRSQVVSALAMPMLMFFMLIVLFLIVGKKVVPTLSSVFPPDKWEGLAGSLYFVSGVVNSYWFVVLLALILIFWIVIFATLSKWKGKLRSFFDKIPPWSFYRLLLGGGWLLSLASLVQSGETVMQSMRDMKDMALSGKSKNPWLHERLNSSITYLSMGKNIGESLDMSGHEFPDREIIEDLISYAEQPNFDETLYLLAKEWIDEGLKTFAVQSKLLNTMSFVMVGGVVAWFVLGLFQLYGQLGEHFSVGGGI